MLRDDVVDAIREGKFNVYAIKTIDEGLEILTGIPAGERQADGSYPIDTVNHQVRKRLLELDKSMRGYYQGLLATAS
jgi:predicted ATP-dependent protease